MPDEPKLHHPWLIAVWPGMGHVAVSAGYYLMAKLEMNGLAEFSPRELFDMEHVEVKAGIIKSGRLPRSRLFVWNDPQGERDLVLFIGEAQPPVGRYLFCHRLIEYARQLGVERVYTFAAMATQMHPERESRVFAAATDEAILAELHNNLGTEVLESGQIGGLNGVLLGVAVEMGLRGGCLLGEMPHLFAQLPFPAASLAVLRVFAKLAKIEVDLGELGEQAAAMGQKLGELLAEVEQKLEERGLREEDDEEELFPRPVEEPRLSPADERRIEGLFDKAREDRSKAYELKGELDRLEVFDLYEDRFLDLFKKTE
ncbi:MAG: PAC2 family protein [Pirellulaceae bacterium]|nr:PAC2 family protein [Pirellulaceae bacterium]